MINSNAHLVYASCPSRLKEKKKEIKDFIRSQGNGPLHPFDAFEFEYFEGGIVGREKTMEFCCRLVNCCDEFALFGISEGTLIELEYFLKLNERNLPAAPKPLRIYVWEFDPEWEKHFQELSPRFKMAASLLKPYLYGS